MLTFCDSMAYPPYVSAQRLLGIPPFLDQQGAGALMWLYRALAYLGLAAFAAFRMLRQERRASQVEAV
ncbi:CytoChrome c oxidase Caa3 assembly factor (fragment) [Candidatus Sulfopaludibacter sp. SbA3]